MLKNKSYRQQFQIYAIGAGIFILVMYQFTFSKTFSEIGHCAELEDKLSSVAHAPAQIRKIEAELNLLSSNLSYEGENAEGFHEHLLNVVSGCCSKNSIQLVSFPKQHIYSENDVEIGTSQFTAQGSFISLLKLMYHLEIQQPTGRLCNVKFYKEKNKHTKRMQLYMHVMVQNISSKQ